MNFRSWRSWVLMGSVAALAYGLGRIESGEMIAPGRSMHRGPRDHSAASAPSVIEGTEESPDSQPTRLTIDQRMDRIRSRRSSGESVSVEQIVRALAAAQQAKNSMRIRELLKELRSCASPEADEALLDLLRSGDPPLRGVGDLWRELLSDMDDDRLPGILTDLLVNFSGRDMHHVGPLWSHLVELVGPQEGGRLVSGELMRADLPQNSSLRYAILKSIETDLGPVVREELARNLKNNNTSTPAFNALLKAGDSESLDVAFDHLERFGPQSENIAAAAGAHLDERRLAALMATAQRDPRVEVLSVLVLAYASPELIRQHAEDLVRMTKRVMLRDVGEKDFNSSRSYRRVIASLDRIVEFAGDEEFRRFLKEQVPQAPRSLRYLLLRASRSG